MRVNLIGGVRVSGPDATLDGRALGGRAEAVLGCLATAPGGFASRDDLADAVWGEELPPTWPSALRNVVTSLRAALRSVGGSPPPDISSEPGGYRLLLPPGAGIDVREIEQALRDAEAAAAGSDARRAVDLATSVMALSGQPAAAAVGRPWGDRFEDHLLDLHVRALRIGCASALAAGDAGPAEAWARELVARQPLREDGHRLLMRALAAGGNRGEALRAYERVRVLLQEELGTIPAFETEDLFAHLLGGGARPDASGAPRIGAAVGRLLVAREQQRFVGRQALVDTLRDELTRARAHGLHLVTVSGEPGLGKTRLAAELMAHAADQGVGILYGRADDRLTEAHGALLDAVSGYAATVGAAEVEDRLGPGAPVLARVIPSLRAAAPVAEPSGIPDLDRLHLVRAVEDALRRAASGSGALLVLDDLQWASRGELDDLAEMVASLGDAPLLVLALHRHPEDALMTRVRTMRRHRVLVLDPLELGEVEELARHQGVAPGRVVQQVWRDSGGNPLIATELLGRPEGGQVPGPVRDRSAQLATLLDERLRLLPPGSEQVLRVAAVVGLEFDPDLVAATAAIEPQVAHAALDAARRSALLVPALDHAGWLAFRHRLVHDALLRRTGPSDLATLHRQVGSVLEARSVPAPAGELAHHFTAAAPLGEWSRALRYGTQTARAAFDAGEYDDVIAVAGRTLATLRGSGDPEPHGRIDLAILLGGAQRALGDPEGFVTLQGAFDDAVTLGDPTRMADAALAFVPMGAATEEVYVDEMLLPRYQQALDALPAGDGRRRARLLGHVACGTAWSTSSIDGWRSAEAALALARDDGDVATVLAVLTTTRRVLSGSYRHGLRRQLEDELFAFADRLDDPGARTRAALWRYETELQAGNGAVLDELVELAASSAAGLRMGHYHHSVAYFRAGLSLLRGDLDTAEQQIEEAAATGRRHGMVEPVVEALRLVHLVELRIEQGRVAEVRDEAVAFFAGAGLPHWLGMVAMVEAEVGHLDAVGGPVDAFLDHYERTGPTMLVPPGLAAVVARPIARLGDPARAERLARLLAGTSGYAGYVAHFVGPMDHALAQLADTAGRPADALHHAALATEVARSLGAPRWLERCAAEEDRRRASAR